MDDLHQQLWSTASSLDSCCPAKTLNTTDKADCCDLPETQGGALTRGLSDEFASVGRVHPENLIAMPPSAAPNFSKSSTGAPPSSAVSTEDISSLAGCSGGSDSMEISRHLLPCNDSDEAGSVGGPCVAPNLLWDEPTQLRSSSFYESINFPNISQSSPETNPPLTQPELLLARNLSVHRKSGAPPLISGSIEQQNILNDFARRRSPTLSSPTSREKAYCLKRRNNRGPVSHAAPAPDASAVSVAAPASFPSDAINGNSSLHAPLTGERTHAMQLPKDAVLPLFSSQPQITRKLYEAAASFVGLLYKSIFDLQPTWQLPVCVPNRGPKPDILDVVAAMYSPWCSRKQLLDPQLVGERPVHHPLFDEGTGQADVQRQLVALKCCLGDFAVTVECMQPCVAGTDRLSCALRGVMRAPFWGPPRDTEGPPKTGRFAHFLTLRSKSSSFPEASDVYGEGRGRQAIEGCSWVSSAHMPSFVIESEVFVALVATDARGLGAPAKLSKDSNLLYDANVIAGEKKGELSVPWGFGGNNVGRMQGVTTRPSGMENETVSSFASMLRAAISLGPARAPSVPRKLGESACGEKQQTGLECMQAAMSQLASGLLADASALHQQTGAWPSFMPMSAQRPRRGRKKKKPRQNAIVCQTEGQQMLPSMASFQTQFNPSSARCWRDEVATSVTRPPSKGILTAPAFLGVPQDAFERTVFVSWIPRAARAQALSGKEAAEEKLKTVLSGDLGICGIERVLVFPPRGSHCCIAFRNSEASMAFFLEYAGGTFTPNTEKFKKRICASFSVEFDKGIQRVFIRIEGVRLMPQAVRA